MNLTNYFFLIALILRAFARKNYDTVETDPYRDCSDD